MRAVLTGQGSTAIKSDPCFSADRARRFDTLRGAPARPLAWAIRTASIPHHRAPSFDPGRRHARKKAPAFKGRGKLAERFEVNSALSALHHRIEPNASCLNPSFNYSQSAFFGQGLPKAVTLQGPTTNQCGMQRPADQPIRSISGGCSGDLLPPSPPAEKANTCPRSGQAVRHQRLGRGQRLEGSRKSACPLQSHQCHKPSRTP